MSRLDRIMDANTGDLQPATRGGFRVDDVLLNKIIFSYTVDRGTFEGDPKLGNLFAELRRTTNTPDKADRLADLVRDASQWLIDSGELERVDVTVSRYSREALAFKAEHFPVGGGKSITVGPFFVKVGG
jgi:phage gp46-like protein